MPKNHKVIGEYKKRTMMIYKVRTDIEIDDGPKIMLPPGIL